MPNRPAPVCPGLQNVLHVLIIDLRLPRTVALAFRCGFVLPIKQAQLGVAEALVEAPLPTQLLAILRDPRTWIIILNMKTAVNRMVAMPDRDQFPRRKQLRPVEADLGGPRRKRDVVVLVDGVEPAKRFGDLGTYDVRVVNAGINGVDTQTLQLGRDFTARPEGAHIDLRFDFL